MPHPHTLPHILTPPCSLHAQEHDTRQKLKAAEKLANSRTIAAREAEHTLRTTAREKREAEVRLAACEDELAALKVEHDDLRRRAKLAQYMRAAPGMRTKASVQVELPLPPEEADAPAAAAADALYAAAAVESSGVGAESSWGPFLALAASARSHRVIASALRNGYLQKLHPEAVVVPTGAAAASADAEEEAVMADVGSGAEAEAFLKGLTTREAVAELVCNPAVAEGLTTLVWEMVRRMQVE